MTSESEYGESSINVLKPKKSYLEKYNPTPSEILKHATDLVINPSDLPSDMPEKERKSLSEKDIE
jgi:hypothetical protein